MRPALVGVSPNGLPAVDRRFYKNMALEYGEQNMARCVVEAGAIPVMLYRAGATDPEELQSHAMAVVQRLDAVIFSGGADMNPASYDETLVDERWYGQPERDAWELALYRAAVAMERPALGVCRGAQLLNVAAGGSLWQDLPTLRPGHVEHRCQDRYDSLSHDLRLEPGSELHDFFEGDDHHVNSVHHQGVCRIAETATPVAWAPDGLVEAFVLDGPAWILGVQWHPEWMPESRSSRRMFARLISQARQAPST